MPLLGKFTAGIVYWNGNEIVVCSVTVEQGAVEERSSSVVGLGHIFLWDGKRVVSVPFTDIKCSPFYRNEARQAIEEKADTAAVVNILYLLNEMLAFEFLVTLPIINIMTSSIRIQVEEKEDRI